jgi:hypothetical protein
MLCSASVDALQTMFGNRSYISTAIYVFRYSKRTHIGVTHLAVTYVIKTATSLGTYRTAISQVMTAYTNHGKTSSAKGGYTTVTLPRIVTPYRECGRGS